MSADQGDELSRRVLGDTLQGATLRLGIIVGVFCVILATITWFLHP
jgi:hypothetical protein